MKQSDQTVGSPSSRRPEAVPGYQGFTGEGITLTGKQARFLAQHPAYRVITVAEHARARRAAQRGGGKRQWPADHVLDWDGELLPMSATLYVGRVYVRLTPAEAQP